MRECVGMLLAGGEGKRLGPLTSNTAKPAVYFGGKYRIIDFSLSNCANSNLHTVGVLTQYSPLQLNEHIGTGEDWGFNNDHGGVSVLSPYTAQFSKNWFLGTADSVYKNLHFIDQYNPTYVLILSGDHIYQMDYRQLLEAHKASAADATISVIEVPWDEASRFGILNVDEKYKITEFVEKPAAPESNLASMGIYLFNWQVLREQLLLDAENEASSHDFGNDIIPTMLAENFHLQAFPFQGYWKDVGTIGSYWDANMDLILDKKAGAFNIDMGVIRSMPANSPPLYVGESSRVQDSFINSGCFIHGQVRDSILFKGVTVEKNSVVHQSIIHPDVVIGADCYLDKVIVMEGTRIPAGVKIVSESETEPTVVNEATIAALKNAHKEVEA